MLTAIFYHLTGYPMKLILKIKIFVFSSIFFREICGLQKKLALQWAPNPGKTDSPNQIYFDVTKLCGRI